MSLYAQPQIRFERDDVEKLKSMAQTGYPFEACGILVGEKQGGVHHVLSVKETRNVCPKNKRDSFELDLTAFLKEEKAARHAGLDVLGFWHTHPDGIATPSPKDLSDAWPEYSYTIIGVNQFGVIDFRSWRAGKNDFHEEQILQAEFNPTETYSNSL